MLGTYGLWAVMVLQRATPTVTRGIRLYWSSPRTCDTITYCRTFGSGAVTTCFYNLDPSRLVFKHPTATAAFVSLQVRQLKLMFDCIYKFYLIHKIKKIYKYTKKNIRLIYNWLKLYMKVRNTVRPWVASPFLVVKYGLPITPSAMKTAAVHWLPVQSGVRNRRW